MKKLFYTALTTLSLSAGAADFSNLKNISQSQFNDIAHDLGAAFSYKSLSPGDPLGLLGFDVGVDVSMTEIRSADTFKKGTGWDLNWLPVSRLHAQKGLPFDLDVGLSVARAPGLDSSLTGAELRWSPLPGNLVLPAVSVRSTYSRLSGVDEFDFTSYGVEAAISKGFLILKPYLGLGYVRSKSTPHVGNLQAVSLGQHKVFGGVNINLGLINYTLEIDQTGESTSYGAKVGLRF